MPLLGCTRRRRNCQSSYYNWLHQYSDLFCSDGIFDRCYNQHPQLPAKLFVRSACGTVIARLAGTRGTAVEIAAARALRPPVPGASPPQRQGKDGRSARARKRPQGAIDPAVPRVPASRATTNRQRISKTRQPRGCLVEARATCPVRAGNQAGNPVMAREIADTVS